MPSVIILQKPRGSPTKIRKCWIVLDLNMQSNFGAFGAACEDACCSGWDVTIDRTTYGKYESLTAMQPRLKECFTVIAEGEGRHARINLDAAARCPFFSQDSLCTIHRDYGESYLSETCTNYPRISRRIDGLIEKPLVLSCPEAARLVLLTPELLPGYRRRDGERGYDRLLAIRSSPMRPDLGPMRYVWEIRELCLLLLLDPVYDLWERLFILGMFCKKLTELIEGSCIDQIPLLLHDYAQIAVEGNLRDAMESVPVRLEAQVAMLLETVNSFFATRRLRCTACTNVSGISLMACITKMRRKSNAVLTITRKGTRSTTSLSWIVITYLMENYLVNHVFRARFPFSKGEPSPSNPLNEYVFMCLEFAAIKGLLIGMAAHYGEAFSLEHVVKLVQIGGESA